MRLPKALLPLSLKNYFLFLIVLGLGSFVQAEVQVSTATGHRIEYDSKNQKAQIKGNAFVQTATATLKADEINLDIQNKVGTAEGHVEVQSSTNNLTSEKAIYHWEASTGVFYGARGESPPWFFQADEMIQRGPDLFSLQKMGLTSCDHDPPHYQIFGRKGNVRVRDRASISNARFVVGDVPSFWLPFYSKSLKDKKYSLKIKVGHNSRDGVITNTSLGYPFSDNTYTTAEWDWLEKTGNGAGLRHEYNNPNIRGAFDGYYIRDHNPDPRPQEKEYTVLWNHYQRFNSQLTFNGKLDFKSSQEFGNNFSNQGNGVRVENSRRGILSEGGFTYSLKKATILSEFRRQDKFDSAVSSKSFISNIVLPRISINTIPLSWKYFPIHTSFNGLWANQTNDRDNPQQSLKYLQNANSGLTLRKDVRFHSWTFTPNGGYQQTWQNFQSTSTFRDIYIGNWNTGLTVRRRIRRFMDVNLGYRYAVRNQENKFAQDLGAPDKGIVADKLNANFVARWLRDNRISLGSGYDLREAPKNNPTKYTHSSERWDPISMDLELKPSKMVTVYFRELYGIYDPSTQKPTNTPLNTSGEIQYGHISQPLFLSQGFSYTKNNNLGSDSVLNLTNRIKLFLTPHWYVDLFLSYAASGPNKLNYSKIKPTEKTLTVFRDLHCWVMRMEFSERGERKEARFFIDLKTNLGSNSNVFSQAHPGQSYLYTDPVLSTEDVFPYKNQDQEHQK